MMLANHGFQMGCMMLALNGLVGHNYGICDLTGEAFWIVHIVFALIWINLLTQFLLPFFFSGYVKNKAQSNNVLQSFLKCVYINMHVPVQYLEHSAFLTAPKKIKLNTWC